MSEGNSALVQVENLKKYFPVMRGLIFERQVGSVRAVDGVSFSIQRGETLGLVGESGCGKTTVGRTILGLYPATEGSIIIDGHDVRHAKGKELSAIRRKRADDLPGPLRLAQPALDGQRHHQRTAAGAQTAAQRKSPRRTGEGTDGTGRLERPPAQSLPPRVFRRAEAAHRCGARPGI
jgi:energy-coupling factor transporter ATP-binding protein EcfA2